MNIPFPSFQRALREEALPKLNGLIPTAAQCFGGRRGRELKTNKKRGKMAKNLREAFLAYEPGKTIEAGDASYGYNGGCEVFKVGRVTYTNFNPKRAPEDLAELQKRFTEIQEGAESYSSKFCQTLEAWLAVLGQLVGT